MARGKAMNECRITTLATVPRGLRRVFRTIRRHLRASDECGGEKSRFLDLPKELSLEIYDYLLVAEEPICPWRPDHGRPLHVDILRTCNQIYQEARPILYGRNTIALVLKNLYDDVSLRAWMRTLRSDTFAYLRHVRILSVQSVEVACSAERATVVPDIYHLAFELELDLREQRVSKVAYYVFDAVDTCGKSSCEVRASANAGIDLEALSIGLSSPTPWPNMPNMAVLEDIIKRTTSSGSSRGMPDEFLALVAEWKECKAWWRDASNLEAWRTLLTRLGVLTAKGRVRRKEWEELKEEMGL